ncbi:unnamed protein product [Calypogeia fissa]
MISGNVHPGKNVAAEDDGRNALSGRHAPRNGRKLHDYHLEQKPGPPPGMTTKQMPQHMQQLAPMTYICPLADSRTTNVRNDSGIQTGLLTVHFTGRIFPQTRDTLHSLSSYSSLSLALSVFPVQRLYCNGTQQ